MIEKNIRLQPHHSRDLLVGRRSDGRRPGYQPPGRGGSSGGPPSQGGGSPSQGGGGGGNGGHDRGGGQHAAQAAAAQAAAANRAAANRAAEQKAAAQRDMQATIAQAERAKAEYDQREASRIAEAKRVSDFAEARKKMTQPIEVGDPTARTPIPLGTVDPYQQSYISPGQIRTDPKPGSVYEPGDYDDIIYGPKKDTGPIDVGFQNIIRKQKIAEDLRQKQQDPDYGQFFRPQPVVEKPPGIMSKVGGGLKKVFGDNPLEWAVNAASLGGYQKAKYAKALLDIKNRKGIYGTALNLAEKGLDKSNIKSTIQKAADLRSRPKGMPEHLGERGFRTRDDTPKGGDGENIKKTIAEQVTQGAGLEEGQKMLGMDDKQIQQIYQGRDLLSTTIEAGVYQGQQLTAEQIKILQNKQMELNKLIEAIEKAQAPVNVAYGGRIDKALGGRSRDIG
jgi:hypothetical protein